MRSWSALEGGCGRPPNSHLALDELRRQIEHYCGLGERVIRASGTVRQYFGGFEVDYCGELDGLLDRQVSGNARKSELPLHKAPETDRRILQSSVTQNKLAARHGVHNRPVKQPAFIDRIAGARNHVRALEPPWFA